MGSGAKRHVRGDAKLQGKERRIEGQENNKFLGEQIEQKRIEEHNKKLDAHVDAVYAFVTDLDKTIATFSALIQDYLKTHDPQFIGVSQQYSERIAKDLREIFEYSEGFCDVLKEDKDYIATFIKDIEKENSLLNKEPRIARRQVRNLRQSAKNHEGLEEAEKNAIIQQKLKINAQLQVINGALLANLQAVLKDILGPDLQQIKMILEHRKDIKKSVRKQSSGINGLMALLDGLKLWIAGKRALVLNLKTRNRGIIRANLQRQGMIEQKKQLFAQKQALDKNYDKRILNEEVQLSHQKALDSITDAL